MIGLGSIQWVENWGDESVTRTRLTIDLRVLFTPNLAKVARFETGKLLIFSNLHRFNCSSDLWHIFRWHGRGIGLLYPHCFVNSGSAVNADEAEETEFRDWKICRRIAAIYVHHVRIHFGKKCKLLPQPSVVVHPKTTQ